MPFTKQGEMIPYKFKVTTVKKVNASGRNLKVAKRKALRIVLGKRRKMKNTTIVRLKK